MDDVPLSGHTVNKFQRLAVLQLNIEGLTASKMNVLHHFHETYCTSADKLTVPGFALAGTSLSRKHGLVTFVNDRLIQQLCTTPIIFCLIDLILERELAMSKNINFFYCSHKYHLNEANAAARSYLFSHNIIDESPAIVIT